ncbi:class I SAM-dependent methyltransferase [Streptomyces sp. NPDC050439]|uniref:class I SAM-dependent methyltransferase n=1 Tax=unclassified Streptomyces TaxID=2593676 RepID=UPI00343A81D8
MLELARHSVPDPDLILDIGCGTGRLPRSCVRCFPKAMVIGIDPCAEMIDQADTSPTPAQWLQARAEALPFGDHVFSLVLSTLSLRHWQDSHQGLAEISRITTHNGTVMIADALINDVLSPPLPGAPSKVSGRRGNPWRVPRRAIRPRARGSARVSAGASYALAQAGLGVEHAEEIVLALATVTLIVASNSTARTT